nr:B3 domain-containing protein Os03g0212300-like [Aegilops tauschii subsp. strangulata]
MHHDPCTWLQLPYAFMREMAGREPLGLWLQPDGCCNGSSWVATEFTSSGFMFLKRGWKSFALAPGLKEGHIVHFKYDRAATLFMKIFGVAGYCHLDCCMESDNSGSSSDGSGTSSEGRGSDDDFGDSPRPRIEEDSD